jgi:hypothetical protein
MCGVEAACRGVVGCRVILLLAILARAERRARRAFAGGDRRHPEAAACYGKPNCVDGPERGPRKRSSSKRRGHALLDSVVGGGIFFRDCLGWLILRLDGLASSGWPYRPI